MIALVVACADGGSSGGDGTSSGGTSSTGAPTEDGSTGTTTGEDSTLDPGASGSESTTSADGSESTTTGGAQGACENPEPLPCTEESVVLSDGAWCIEEDCSLGALTLEGDACLQVMLPSDATLEVAGDLRVADAAQLHAEGGTLRIANPEDEAYELMVADDATLELRDLEVATQDGTQPDAVFMRAFATDRAAVVAENVTLDEQTSWLLFDASGESTVSLTDPERVPTELYLYDAAALTMRGGHIGLWLSYQQGASTVTLPDQSDGPFDWTVEASKNAAWSVAIEDAQPGIGVNAWPGSDVTIIGTGGPETGELTLGYFAGAGENVTGLDVGLVQSASIGGRLHLENVHLGPVAWQLYSLGGMGIVVEDSVINELGVVGAGDVTIRNSTLQFGLLAALGGGIELRIEDSVVYNQQLLVDGDGQVSLNDCEVHGTELRAADETSSITISGGSFFDNPPGCTPNTMVDVATGQPLCNPFNQPGPPMATGSGVVTCDGTSGCRL